MVIILFKEGTMFWINNQEMKATFEYPYLEELRSEVNKFQNNFSQRNSKNLMKDNLCLEFILFEPENGKSFLRILKKEIAQLLEGFLFGNNQKESFHDIRRSMIKMKEQLQLMCKIKLDLEDFINIVFFCEFDFQSYVIE